MLAFFYNLLSKSFIILMVALLSANYLPSSLFEHEFPFEPKSMETLRYDLVKPDWNTKLSDNPLEYIQLNQILGPESVAISPNNKQLLYTGLADGRLVELDGGKKYKLRQVLRFSSSNKCQDNVAYHSDVCGRFLQLRFHETNGSSSLYAIEAYTGLYKIDTKLSKKTLLGPKQLQPVNLFNSFAFDPIDADLVYLTVSSTRWPLLQIFWSLLELEGSGQIVALNMVTGKRVVLRNNLMLPNGIEVDPKRGQLIFTESTKSRINSLDLTEVRNAFKQAKDGEILQETRLKMTNLIPLMPGFPDNIHVQDDLAYIAMPFVKLNGSELVDNLSDAPMLRKAYGRIAFTLGKVLEFAHNSIYPLPALKTLAQEFKSGHFNYRITQSDRAALIVYNLETGSSKLFGSDKFGYISEATPDGEGNLLLGSFRSPFIVKIKMPAI